MCDTPRRQAHMPDRRANDITARTETFPPTHEHQAHHQPVSAKQATDGYECGRQRKHMPRPFERQREPSNKATSAYKSLSLERSKESKGHNRQNKPTWKRLEDNRTGS